LLYYQNFFARILYPDEGFLSLIGYQVCPEL
jgi:hypothetical protein